MKTTGRRRPADIVMLGTFGVWTRGTLQSRALPFARAITASTGLDVAIVTTPWDAPDAAGASEEVDGVRIFNTVSHRPASAPLAAAEQLRLVRELNPGIIHVMKPKGFGGLAVATRRLLPRGSRLVVDADDWEGDGGWNDAGSYGLLPRRLFARQETDLIRRADAVTAASTLLDERARRLRRQRSESGVKFLPNGLDREWARRLGAATPQHGSTTPRVLLYSRFAEFSLAWLQEFVAALDRGVDESLRLEFVGDFDPAALAEMALGNLTLHSHGYVERERIPEILAGATVAVFPYEDTLINRAKQSVKLLELMASGRPVVATDVGDVARIAGDAVVICPTTDPADFARRVLSLLAHDEQRQALSARARKRAAEYTIDRLAPRLLDVYRNLGLAA